LLIVFYIFYIVLIFILFIKILTFCSGGTVVRLQNCEFGLYRLTRLPLQVGMLCRSTEAIEGNSNKCQ
jgi:hypothetical protein